MEENDLIKENNGMLKEILDYVRKVDSREYREKMLCRSFCAMSAPTY